MLASMIEDIRQNGVQRLGDHLIRTPADIRCLLMRELGVQRGRADPPDFSARAGESDPRDTADDTFLEEGHDKVA